MIDDVIKELEQNAKAWKEYLIDCYGDKAKDVFNLYRKNLDNMCHIYEIRKNVSLSVMATQNTIRYLKIMNLLQNDARVLTLEMYYDKT